VPAAARSGRLRLLVIGLGVLALALTSGSRAADRDIRSLAARIDQRIAAAWGKDVQPAPLADDAEFFRRVHLDLAGRIPSVTEIRDFLDDDRQDKRRIWVDRILQADPNDPSYRDAYINHFANVWRAWLLTQPNQQALFQQSALEHWLRQCLKANLGYDQLVRDLLIQEPANFKGRNRPIDGTATAFYLANEFQPENLAGATARLFLGVKLECAQCHNHPFARWTRNQFWEYAAFFTDVPESVRGNQPSAKGGRGQIKITGTERLVRARFLSGEQPKWKDDKTRPTLVDWMTAAENPFFARAAVNRMWGYFFGIGLVDQLDAPGEANPHHRQLLDDLAKAFVTCKYDVKFLIRAIVASRTYQRASVVSPEKGVGSLGPSDLAALLSVRKLPTPFSGQQPRLFARMPLRGLSPEQLFDSLAVATEYEDSAAPDEPRENFFGPQSPRATFLAKFPVQEEKTDYQTSILQALYLMNSDFVADRTSPQKNRTLATLAEQQTSTARKIESLYLVVLSRKPRPGESERFVKYVDAGDPKKTLADVFWVLLNSPEFILNH
jgi:hypothetical protein